MAQSESPAAVDDGGGLSELMLKLRVAEVCRQAWRISQHVQCNTELADVVAADIVDALELPAAAIWELDRAAATWRLMGCGGDLDLQGWRSHLAAIRCSVKSATLDIIDTLSDDAQRQLHSMDRSRAWATRHHPVAVALGGRTSSDVRVLVTWSEARDESLLLVATESIARDVGLVFDAVADRLQNALHARSYNVLFNNLPSAIAGIDREGRCSRWNEEATRLFGWDAAEVVNEPLRIVAPAGLESFQATVDLCRDHIRPCNMRLTCQRETGATLQAQVLCLPVMDRDARSEVLLVISDESLNDIRQRLSRCEVDVASLLSTATTIEGVGQQLLEMICRRMEWRGGELWQISGDGQRWNCSAVWTRSAPSTGVSIQPGCSLRSDAGVLGMAHRTRDIACVEGDDGSYDLAVPISCDGDVQAVAVFFGVRAKADDELMRTCLHSIASRIGQALSRERMQENLQKAEASLQQNRKMEAVGMLAGGIAHDFNNLIMVILGNCELLQARQADAALHAEMIDEIRVVGERAATLTRKLLSFSRKRTSEPEALNPLRLLKECENMLERLATGDVVVETQVREDVHAIRIDPIEFEQLLLNLVANARDAMPDGGRITISLANVGLALRDVLAFPDVRPGDFVELSVADTGCGMDAQTQARAFEPFFTTKEQDKGTGLGLATVYGITRRNHGIIRIESAPGAGTRFVICFPRATLGIKPRRIDSLPAEDPRGNETVLIVDDEDAIRRLVQRILEVHGYNVLAADGGAVALGMLNRPGQVCDLLLTDVMMPEMKGTRLAQEARKLRADLPVLFMSGYHESAEALDSARDSVFLSKPFSSDVLVKAVRHALDAIR